MTPLRVLLLSQYFPPEVGATQTRVEVFARHLAAAGHDVTVVAEVPNHPLGVVFEGWGGRLVDRRRENGYEVVRVWVHASVRKSFWRRISFYATYGAGAVVASLAVVRRRPDVVVASSPPLPVLVAAWAVGAVWRRPFVADVRDLWPAVGVALGELRGRRVVAAARRLERFLYRRAAAVTCVTRRFVDHVVASGADPAKVVYLPNGTVPALFGPERARAGLAAALGLEGRFVVGYVGLHGIAQGLPAVLDAAERLAGDDGVRFLLVGEGPVKAELVASAAARGLGNVVFHPQVPTDEVAAYLGLCDVVVVPLRPLELLSGFVPSKLFDAMACARPVILMVDGEARSILEEAGAGVWVEPGSADGLARAVADLRDRPADRAIMGRRGRAHVLAHYDRAVGAARLEAVVRAVAGRRAPAGDLTRP